MREGKPKEGFCYVEVTSGPEGPCLSIGDDRAGTRIAGPKPWGGGRTIHRFHVSAQTLIDEATAYLPELPSPNPDIVKRPITRRIDADGIPTTGFFYDVDETNAVFNTYDRDIKARDERIVKLEGELNATRESQITQAGRIYELETQVTEQVEMITRLQKQQTT